MISRSLISAEALRASLTDLLVLDARAAPGADEAYQRDHVSGALRADLERDLSTPTDAPINGGRHPLPSFEAWLARLGSWGIDPSTSVAIYDAHGGGLAAARAWWMLRSVGHPHVAVVDGGWEALLSAGVPRDAKPVTPRQRPAYPCSLRGWPVVDADFVDRHRLDSATTLIDARAPERYRGEVEPLDPVAGRIPGAVNVFWRSQLNADDRFLDRSELAANIDAALEGMPPDRIVCYCGSGVTACHVLLGLELAGYEGAELYPGSWSEWCRQERPRETG